MNSGQSQPTRRRGPNKPVCDAYSGGVDPCPEGTSLNGGNVCPACGGEHNVLRRMHPYCMQHATTHRVTHREPIGSAHASGSKHPRCRGNHPRCPNFSTRCLSRVQPRSLVTVCKGKRLHYLDWLQVRRGSFLMSSVDHEFLSATHSATGCGSTGQRQAGTATGWGKPCCRISLVISLSAWLAPCQRTTLPGLARRQRRSQEV